MNLRQALSQAEDSLAAGNIADANLEAEILLRHTLHITRTQLFTGPERELTPEEALTYRQLIHRRISGEPSAYITGCREFYGHDFYVDRRVLIPRPETELLVEKAIALVQSRKISTLADIGTGCGAIAVSLALEITGVKIFATDISAEALEVARINCRKHNVMDRVTLLRGSLLEPLAEPVDLIIANLPYVKASELPTTGEPRLALDGGADGLDVIRELCGQASRKLKSGGCLLLEVGMGQADEVAGLLRTFFPTARIEVLTDLAGIERVVSLRRV